MGGLVQKIVRGVVDQDIFEGARWGVCAQWRGAPEQGDLIDINADTFFTPASNTKLYTIAAAEARLGLESVLSTELWLSEVDSGNTPVLTLKGGGDPSLTFAHLEKAAAAVASQLDGDSLDVVVDVSVFGRSAIPDAWDWDYVSTISGVLPSSVVVDRNTMQLTVSPTEEGAPAQLVWEHAAADETVEVDNSVCNFIHVVWRIGYTNARQQATAHYHIVAVYSLRHWHAEQVKVVATADAVSSIQAKYRIAGGSGSVVLGLSGEIAVGADPTRVSVPTLRPDRRAGLLLAEALATVGVKVKSTKVLVGTDNDVGQRRLLHTISSAPMRDILCDTMQPSDNLYAECLLRLLAPNPISGASTGASISAAQAQLSQAVEELGVDLRRLRLLDGSGMCAKNWISPRASIELLQGKRDDDEFDDFLPVAALDEDLTTPTGQHRLKGGTLASRFHGTIAAGKLRAKTGTLGGTAALSGYYKDTLVFSIMVNNVVHADSHAEIVAAVDKVAVALCAAADDARATSRL